MTTKEKDAVNDQRNHTLVVTTNDDEGDSESSETHSNVKRALRGVGLGFLAQTKGIIFAALVFLLGSVSGVYMDQFVRSLHSEFFGPSIEELLQKEKINENFSAIQDKLDKISKDTSPEELSRIGGELRGLLESQKEYVSSIQQQAASYHAASAGKKRELLKGVAPQADFSLPINRAVTLGEQGNIFSVISAYDDSRVRVNLNGRRHTLSPGDQVNLSMNEETCVIGYVGFSDSTSTSAFNLTCSPT